MTPPLHPWSPSGLKARRLASYGPPPKTVVKKTLPGAIDQILLAQRDEFSSLPEMLTLKGPRGGEGPTRPTLTLILDRSHGTLGTPVDLRRELHVGGRHVGEPLGSDRLELLLVPVHDGDELGRQEVAKAVHAKGVGVDTHGHQEVVMADLALVPHVDLLTERLLGRVTVFLAYE